MINLHPIFRPAFVITILLLGGLQSPLTAQTPPSSSSGTPIYTCDFSTDPLHLDDPQMKCWTNTPDKTTWDQATGHLTKGSIKLTNTDPAKNAVIYSPFIPYTGPTLHVTVELKQDNVTKGQYPPAIAVYYYDQQHQPLSLPTNLYHDQKALPDGTVDWTTYDETYTFPSGSPPPAFARVVVNLTGVGTIWVDKAVLSTP